MSAQVAGSPPAQVRERAAPALPWDEVLEVLRGWSGRGQLYAALAAANTGAGDEWSARDVERRARRVLFAEALPSIARLPVRVSGWLDALPAQSRRRRIVDRSPVGRVDWVATRIAGWPPSTFVASQRHRQPDELLTTTLRWTLERLGNVRDDAVRVVPGLDADVRRQLDAAAHALTFAPLSDATPIRPSLRDLAAVRQSGRPWTSLAELAAVLLTEDSDLEQLARRVLVPDEELRWRLFHLGCLGAVLNALRAEGCSVRWLRPLGAASSGPAYRVTDGSDREWDLWFEAAGMWRAYRRDSPYRAVRTALPGAVQPLGADLALVLPGVRALLFECKYSNDVTYVGRDGYEQALAYLVEARTALVDDAEVAVIGPAGVVDRSASVQTVSGRLTIAPPAGIGMLVHDLLTGRTDQHDPAPASS